MTHKLSSFTGSVIWDSTHDLIRITCDCDLSTSVFLFFAVLTWGSIALSDKIQPYVQCSNYNAKSFSTFSPQANDP